LSVYLIAALVVGGAVVTVLASYYFFFRTGVTQGQNDTAKADLDRQRAADVIVNTEVSKEDVQKSLRDGTF
jgi:hypothetical protein